MKNLSHIVMVLVVAASSMFVACSPKSPKNLPDPGSFEKPADKEDLGEYTAFNPFVDILFVIDNSGSMATHQSNLSSNIDYFIEGLSKNQILDYNIGVITSDSEKLRGTTKVITKKTIGNSDLKNNLLAGIGGWWVEIFLDYISEALSPTLLTGVNKGFYRPDALLATVILTDAEDQGNLTPKKLYDDLVAMKGGKKELVAAYSVLIPPGETRCARDDGSVPMRLIEYTNYARGLVFNLCDPDYGKKLLKIANDISEKVGLTIPLKKVPVVDTIVVTYGSQTIPNDDMIGWTYDPETNSINFGKDLKLEKEPKGTKIFVDFVAADL